MISSRNPRPPGLYIVPQPTTLPRALGQEDSRSKPHSCRMTTYTHTAHSFTQAQAHQDCRFCGGVQFRSDCNPSQLHKTRSQAGNCDQHTEPIPIVGNRHFKPVDGHCKFLRNDTKPLPDYMVSHVGRWHTSNKKEYEVRRGLFLIGDLTASVC
jgi:hypothetical protein